MVDVNHFRGFRGETRGGKPVTAGAQPAIRADEPPSTARAEHFTNAQIAALFAVLAAIASIPILLYPWPPLGDYINHLSRMHVIATVRSDPDLARFYQIDWQVIPNLMMDLIVPLLYNSVFLVGTMNYLFGIGLSLWALAAWAALRERAMALRLAVSMLFVLALFFCHLFSVGVYALGLIAFELERLRTLRGSEPLSSLFQRRPDGRPSPLLDFVACGLPFLPVIPLMLMSPTWGLRWDFNWELNGKLSGLIFVIEVYSHSATLFLAAIVAAAAVWSIRHRALHFHPCGWVLLVVGGVTYFVMPRVMFDTYMADQRLPIALAFMIIACAHLDLRDYFVRRGFATVRVLMLAVRAFEVQSVWHEVSRGTSAFRDSVRQIDRGAKVLVAYADPDNGDNARELWLMHAACLAIIERSALVTTAFTVLGKQVMHVRRNYRDRVDTEDGTPPSVKQLLQPSILSDDDEPPYWANWTADFDYVYVLFTGAEYPNPDPSRLAPVYAGNRFMLYKIVVPVADAD